MNGQRTAGLVASAVLAATVLATSAVAGSPKVSQADRAMGERYQAMAQSWAQATGAVSSSPLAQKALVERYQAMARYYAQTGQTGQPIVAYLSEDFTTATVWQRTVDGRALTFTAKGDWLQDVETGSSWDPFTGRALRGPLAGRLLTRVASSSALWYAWKAQYPDTRVFGDPPR